MMSQRIYRDSSVVSNVNPDAEACGRRTEHRFSSATPDRVGSDKENATRHSVRSNLGKRKSSTAAMSSPAPSEGSAAKRRRLEEKGKSTATLMSRVREKSKGTDKMFYDPDQDETSKRQTTRRLRELNTELNDSRAEYLQRGSKGLQNTIRQADELIADVKQTSAATIDSRLLVTVGDLTAKKINTMTLGDSSTAIDVDDFLTQCISFMRTDGGAQTQSTQRRRQARRSNISHADDEDNEEEEQEIDLDWAKFGRELCFPASRRPCLSSFLLGPLSVQKKVRAPTQRRATQRAAADPALLARPTELDEEALGRKDNYSLTQVCSEIAGLLDQTERQGMDSVQEEVDDLEAAKGREATDEEIDQIMRKHHLRANGGVPMFDFCVNPKSFGQTVENFFYISFLVKEGKVGLSHDKDDMPTLNMVKAKSLEERQESVRNQAVFSLSFDIWQELVDSFGIEESVIPHREAEAYEADDGVLRDTTNSDQVRSVPIGVDFESDELYAGS